MLNATTSTATAVMFDESVPHESMLTLRCYGRQRFAETSSWSTSGCFCEDPAVVILHELEMTARLLSALFQIQTLQTWECLHLCPVGTLS